MYCNQDFNYKYTLNNQINGRVQFFAPVIFRGTRALRGTKALSSYKKQYMRPVYMSCIYKKRQCLNFALPNYEILTETRLRSVAPVGSFRSLSGLATLSCSPALNGSSTPPPSRRRFALCRLALRPSANPLIT